ncbi:MarR family EPS-associated transcriptional regulator [Thermithiobacillus plumbiphilus]|uniref:MarR family EPS-associated transcriptional regulator n=1 Tax=Thermithiobacillus plumbiphilus TaxID=1729899 RepID=A0ABU9D610_9PROT
MPSTQQHPTSLEVSPHHGPGQAAAVSAVLDDATRYQLLRLLNEHPNISQRELAHKLGISLGKTNYCLKALINKGWIKAGNFRRNPQKRATYAYLLTPSGIEEKARVTVSFLQRKMGEYDALREEIARLRAEVAQCGVHPEREAQGQ